jgi:hypothetical protein
MRKALQEVKPVFPCHQVILGKFIEDFWDYYRELLAYKDAPSADCTPIKSKFWRLFNSKRL